MKTIAFYDKATGEKGMLKAYYKKGETRHERIKNGLKELKHVSNIAVYLVNGKKTRFLFSKPL